VLRTTVGYTGGTTSKPTYRDMADHSEAIRIEYDPQQVSYQELLTVFWESHDPTYQTWGRQYRNALFYNSEDQKLAAEKSLAAISEQTRGAIQTAIEPAVPFTAAEDYHQKYLLRKADGIATELREIYPEEQAFVASTAAARLNGYLGCNGEPETLAKEVGELGLSPAMQNRLIEYVSTACGRFSGLTCPAPQ
jgi:methionine-S-sulfoxide reductase